MLKITPQKSLKSPHDHGFRKTLGTISVLRLLRIVKWARDNISLTLMHYDAPELNITALMRAGRIYEKL